MWANLRKKFIVQSSPSPPDTYTYAPLQADEIRLLWLTPKGQDGELRGILEHCSQKQVEAYRCLSYTWGSPRKCRSLIINDEHFGIAQNLADALEMLVSLKDPSLHPQEPIWIDAICINQADDMEKSIQVAKMSSIYRQASTVLCWLGPASKNSDLALDTLHIMFSKMHEIDETVEIPQQLEATERMIRDSFFNKDATPTTKGLAVNDFFRRTFWTRVWIVQEVNLSSKASFLCGSRVIDIETLRFVFAILVVNFGASSPIEARNPGELFQSFPTAPGFTLGMWGGEDQSNLKSGLKILSVSVRKVTLDRRKSYDTHSATDPRDYIYGLSGIVSQDCADLGIVPDYHLSSQQLYTQVAQAFLEKRGHLDILSYCQFPRVTPNLPTWVPDWAMCMHPALEMRADKLQFYAAGETSAKVLFVEDTPSILHISGIIVGQIISTGPNYEKDSLFQKWFTKDPILFDILDTISQLIHLSPALSSYSTPAAQEDAIWRTAILDCESLLMAHLEDGTKNPQSGRIKRASAYMYENFQAVVRLKAAMDERQRTGVNGPLSSDQMADLQRFEIYKEEVRTAMMFRRVFSVGGRYVAVGPWQLQVGDTLVIFEGCSVPFVLRQEKYGCYSLIGEAYVHGIMYGEFMESRNGKAEIFKII